MLRLLARILLFMAAVLAVFGGTGWIRAGEKPRFAGPTEDGYLLPNGWTITPVGRQVPLTDLPLNILPLEDGKRVLVACNGFNAHQLALIDAEQAEVLASKQVRDSWFGLARIGERLYWSGGGSKQLHPFRLAGDQLDAGDSIPMTIGKELSAAERFKRPGFRAGMVHDDARKLLYSLDIEAGTIDAFDPRTNKIVRTQPIGGRPYDVAIGKGGHRLFVSDWAGRAVLILSAHDFRVLGRIPVGEHPNQIAPHPTDDRLFVACANSNCVSVIDAKRGIVTETIYTSLFPLAPEGSTPDAVAVAPDGKTLYVANADNNCIAVVDVASPSRSEVKGFIPTGWYPTAVAVSPDGKNLYVGVGKGNQVGPNPINDADREKARKATGDWRIPFKYIGTVLSGALSIVPVPDEDKLRDYTAIVYRNCPYSDKLLSGAESKAPTAIPTKVGDPCPITHVIYIIKENRTYDQVFGDMPRGNGDPSLVMFGREVTPNHHKLAEEFVLLDNLYCNGQVSRDGHPWSTMAYNTDYTARDWMLTYSGRQGIDDDDEGNLSRAPSGYLWDAAGRAGISYRNYGEYGRRVSQPDGSLKMEAAVPGLVGHMCPDYGLPKVPHQRVRDTDNVEVFLREFREFEKNDTLPRLCILSLGEDHTSGTRPGAFTPQACVGSNDLALGRLVDAVSKSKYWPRMAIFVIEDDAQNGPDHVDAHRTVGLVISPYVRRRALVSEQYTTVSVIRTIELILGLPPLSQYDAAARPMYECFSDKADLTAYDHLPAQIDLNAVNAPTAYGAERSEKMDFSEYDRIDDFELNEILWRAIKGKDAPLPPAVRRALAFRPSLLAAANKD